MRNAILHQRINAKVQAIKHIKDSFLASGNVQADSDDWLMSGANGFRRNGEPYYGNKDSNTASLGIFNFTFKKKFSNGNRVIILKPNL